MQTRVKNILLISLGWFFVILGAIGAVLPLLPTTPFMILALGLFARSSPKFHAMLLNHKWFGPPLQQWEATHTMRSSIKKKVIALITLTFSVSIAVLWGRQYLPLMLIMIYLVLLFFILRIKESG